MPETTLAIDYGTSNTAAMLRWPDRRVRPLLFDGSPLLPSAVYLEPGGTLRAGSEAVRSARLEPARYEPNPKRRVDEGMLLLGEQEVPIAAAMAATLRVVRDEACRTTNAAPTSVVLTYPVAWGAHRRAVLIEATARAGLPTPRLVPEPIAAAAYFVDVQGSRLADGESVVVYDLGAGTFDVSVVSAGFETLAYQGLDDLGGVDLDALVVDQIGAALGGAPELLHPDSLAERRAFRQLWDDARAAKESLSRRASTEVLIPLLDRDVQITREAFDAAARPLLERSVAVTASAMKASGASIAGVFLVGGSTRVPLVATLLHQRLGIAPTVLDHPELVVAEGALHAVPEATTVSATTAVGAAGMTITSRPWLIALRGLALMTVGGLSTLFAVSGIGATLLVLSERYEYLSDAGSLRLLCAVLLVGVAVFDYGTRVTARVFDQAQLGFERSHLAVRLTPMVGRLLVRSGGRLLIGAAFASAFFEVAWYGARNVTAWAALVVCGAGVVLSLAGAGAELRRWSRGRSVRIDATGSTSAGTAKTELAWDVLATAEIRPYGWRRSRTLLVSLAPGAAPPAPPALLRPVRGSEALRVMDLGAYSMPVLRVEEAVRTAMSARGD